MNNHFKKIYFLAKAILNQLKQWFLELTLVWKVGVVLVALGVIFLGYKFIFVSTKAQVIENPQRVVELINIGDLANSSTTIPLVGIVTSVSEAKIQAETSGKLTKVYKKLGDKVIAGQIIAEFENSSERAAVLQAQGAFESAKAGRDIQLINSAATSNTIGDTKANILNTIDSAFSTMEDSVHNKVDTIFVDPRAANLQLKIQTTDQILEGKVISERVQIERLLEARKAQNQTLTVNSDLSTELLNIKIELQTLQIYLENLSLLYSRAVVSDSASQILVDSGKANVSAFRAVVIANITNLNQARTTLSNSLAAQSIAGGKNSSQNVVGPSDLAAIASVKTAEGAYLGVLARLQKTIVRSPITGTLNSLTVQTGDFVPQTTQVAVVSNNNALEIKAYVSEDDSRRITVGENVLINGNVNSVQKGIVTRLAGAIDPVTKKIEVRVGIIDEKTTFINGESVGIQIQNSKSVETNKNLNLSANTKIKIPLSAIKITPNGAFVFTLSASSTLQALPVGAGALMGEDIQIESGLSNEMSIIKDARGLKDGMTVKVK